MLFNGLFKQVPIKENSEGRSGVKGKLICVSLGQRDWGKLVSFHSHKKPESLTTKKTDFSIEEVWGH